MKGIYKSYLIKTFAVILLVITLAASVAGIIGIMYMGEQKMFNINITFSDTPKANSISYSNMEYIAYLYLSSVANENAEIKEQYNEAFKSDYLNAETNFYFEITDEQGNMILDNYADSGYSKKYFYNYYNEYDKKQYVINGYLSNTITADDDYYKPYTIFTFLNKYKTLIVVLTLVSAVLFIFSFVFIIISAGYKRGSDEPQLSFIDKIPLEILLTVYSFFMMFSAMCVDWHHLYKFTDGVITVLFMLGMLLVSLLFITSIAVRIKCDKFLKGSVLYNLGVLTHKGI